MSRDGWLPPQAPGGQPPPHFDMVVPAPHEPAGSDSAAGSGGEAILPSGPAVPHHFRTPRERQPRVPAAPAGSSPTNGLALTSLILGLLGIALLLLTVGLGFAIALPCSISAWMCGAQARTRIALGEAVSGRGQATAGYLLGVAGVVIGVAAAVGWIVWLANGGDLEQLQHDLQRYRDTHAPGAIWQAARWYLGR